MRLAGILDGERMQVELLAHPMQKIVAQFEQTDPGDMPGTFGPGTDFIDRDVGDVLAIGIDAGRNDAELVGLAWRGVAAWLASGLERHLPTAKTRYSVPHQFFTCRLDPERGRMSVPTRAGRFAKVVDTFAERGCAPPRLPFGGCQGAGGSGSSGDRRRKAQRKLSWPHLSDAKKRRGVERISRASEVHPKVHRRACSCGSSSKSLIEWRSLRDSNPCFSLERAMFGAPFHTEYRLNVSGDDCVKSAARP